MASEAEAWARLRAAFADMPGAVIAYSGGVDSAVLLTAAREILGGAHVLAVIADSPSLARAELFAARAQAEQVGVELRVLYTEELEDPRYRANAGDRCFWCKEALFTAAAPLAEERGWALCYGENADDVGTLRPGARSAAARGVRAPLREAAWSKETVRAFARTRGLPSAEKPAAPCLASRVPDGIAVSAELLARVEGFEAAVARRGFRVLRVRHYGAASAVLEVAAEELARARSLETLLCADAALAGYETLTLRAYRSGAATAAGRLEV